MQDDTKVWGLPVSFCRATTNKCRVQTKRWHSSNPKRQGACTSIVRQSIDKAPYATAKASIFLYPFFKTHYVPRRLL